MWTASGSALNGRGKPCPRLILQGLEETAAYRDEAGKRYTGFMLQTLGLPLPGDYGQVPAKLWYLHKCNAQKLCVNLKMIPRYDPIIL